MAVRRYSIPFDLQRAIIAGLEDEQRYTCVVAYGKGTTVAQLEIVAKSVKEAIAGELRRRGHTFTVMHTIQVEPEVEYPRVTFWRYKEEP